jgi:hypothetical protein
MGKANKKRTLNIECPSPFGDKPSNLERKKEAVKSPVSSSDQKHRKGYEKHPVRKGEFDIWESEQVWEELARRLDAYHRNPQAGSPWAVVKARIKG